MHHSVILRMKPRHLRALVYGERPRSAASKECVSTSAPVRTRRLGRGSALRTPAPPGHGNDEYVVAEAHNSCRDPRGQTSQASAAPIESKEQPSNFWSPACSQVGMPSRMSRILPQDASDASNIVTCRRDGSAPELWRPRGCGRPLSGQTSPTARRHKPARTAGMPQHRLGSAHASPRADRIPRRTGGRPSHKPPASGE